MIKNAVSTFLILVALFVLQNLSAQAYDLSEIKKMQTSLNFLKEEDFSILQEFSEYDFALDKKLSYNPEAREVVSKFENAEQHCKQSNVAVAYYEYRNLLRDMKKNDFYYMHLAYQLVENGFFSLAHMAMMKVEDKEIWAEHIDFIRKYYFPKTISKVPQEVFLAGLLADIVYNNMTDESIMKLEKEGKILADYDYTDYIRARAYLSDKDYKNALLNINNAISKNSDNILYKKLKAEILNASGKEADAIKVVKQIQNSTDIVNPDLKKDLDKILYYALSQTEKVENEQKYYLANYFYLNNDYSRAINELKLLMIKGETVNSPKLLGKIYEITGKNDEAEKLYNKMISKNKKCAYAHRGLGNIYLSRKKYGEALSEYKLAEKQGGKELDTLTGMTISLFKIHDLKNALKYMHKANKSYPENFKVLYLNSKLANDKGIVNLKTSICQNPYYPGGWLDLTQKALDLSDTESAEEYINTAAFITKNSARYFYYKSLLNTEKKDYETAEKDIQRAAELVKQQTQTGVDNEEI